MEYLRETVVRDVVDILGGVKDKDYTALIDKFANNKYSSSIAKSSKDLIMTFPVLCSNTLEPKTATMVSKAIERKCVTMLHLLFCAMTVTDAKDAKELIAQYHNNISISGMGVDDIVKLSIDTADAFGSVTGAEMNQLLGSIKEDMKGLYRETPFMDSINERSIQDFKIMSLRGDQVIIDKFTPVQEATKKNNTAARQQQTAIAKNISGINKDKADMQKSSIESFSKRLLDNDAKKCNELVPSLLIVNFATPNSDGKASTFTCIVGVKARLIPVDSFEIIDKIFVKHNDKNTLLKLIRCSTREISFFKDFLFAIDKAKVDALSQSRKGSVNPIWKVLERRSIKSKVRKAIRSSNDATAITSLVVTQEEVNYLKNNYNINLDSIGVAKQIMEAYNLLSIEIVDESIEVVKFLFDGEDNYETLSFNNLERESSDGMYKKVITLMSKMNR